MRYTQRMNFGLLFLLLIKSAIAGPSARALGESHIGIGVTKGFVFPYSKRFVPSFNIDLSGSEFKTIYIGAGEYFPFVSWTLARERGPTDEQKTAISSDLGSGDDPDLDLLSWSHTANLIVAGLETQNAPDIWMRLGLAYQSTIAPAFESQLEQVNLNPWVTGWDSVGVWSNVSWTRHMRWGQWQPSFTASHLFGRTIWGGALGEADSEQIKAINSFFQQEGVKEVTKASFSPSRTTLFFESRFRKGRAALGLGAGYVYTPWDGFERSVHDVTGDWPERERFETQLSMNFYYSFQINPNSKQRSVLGQEPNFFEGTGSELD